MNSVRSRALGVAAGRGVWEGVFVCNQCTEKLTQIHAADISGAWKFTDLDALLVWLTERQRTLDKGPGCTLEKLYYGKIVIENPSKHLPATSEAFRKCRFFNLESAPK